MRSHAVLVAVNDLFFALPIENALKRMGWEPAVVDSCDAALAHARERLPDMAIVDFGRADLEPARLVAGLKAIRREIAVLGFISHKSLAAARPAARAAGCDLLVANSALSARLPQLLERLASRRPEDAGKLQEMAADPADPGSEERIPTA